MMNYVNDFSDTSRMNMVEIGSYVGDSTKVFARFFQNVYCIDPWVNGYDDNDEASYKYPMSLIEKQFDKAIEKFSNVHKIKGYSKEKAAGFHEVDMVYIDAIHTYKGVTNDIAIWKPKIKKGGFLAGHDYQRRFQGVIDAVNEFKKPDKVFKDTSWIIRI